MSNLSPHMSPIEEAEFFKQHFKGYGEIDLLTIAKEQHRKGFLSIEATNVLLVKRPQHDHQHDHQPNHQPEQQSKDKEMLDDFVSEIMDSKIDSTMLLRTLLLSFNGDIEAIKSLLESVLDRVNKFEQGDTDEAIE